MSGFVQAVTFAAGPRIPVGTAAVTGATSVTVGGKVSWLSVDQGPGTGYGLSRPSTRRSRTR